MKHPIFPWKPKGDETGVITPGEGHTTNLEGWHIGVEGDVLITRGGPKT